eukprot:scaffold49440_cov58-Phaeocystis_antarctica.AAC.2
MSSSCSHCKHECTRCDAREGQSWVTVSSRQSLGMKGVGVEDGIGWAGYSANNRRQRGSQRERRCCSG